MAQPPLILAAARSPAQMEDDRLQLTYFIRDVLMSEHAFDEQTATGAGEAIAAALAELEGNELSAAISAFRQRARQRRDEAIRAELRTGNAEAIARQYQLSVRRVYEIAGMKPR